MYAGYAQFGHYLYVVGGSARGSKGRPSQLHGATQRLDMTTGHWQVARKLPKARQPALVATSTALYAIGGADNRTATDVVDRLDTTAFGTARWTPIEHLPTGT